MGRNLPLTLAQAMYRPNNYNMNNSFFVFLVCNWNKSLC